MGALELRRLARPRTRPVWNATSEMVAEASQRQEASTSPTSRFPWARAWAPRCSRPSICIRTSATACSSTTCRFTPAAQRHRGRHRPQRRGQVHAVQDDRGHRSRSTVAATLEHRRDRARSSYVDQNRAGHRRLTRRCGKSCPTALTTCRWARPRFPSRAYVVGIRLQRFRPAEAGRRAFRRRAQPPEPGAHAQAGRQPTAARRAHQRPRRRDARAASKRRFWPSRAARSSSATTAWFLDRVATHILAWEGDRREPRQLVLVRGQLRVATRRTASSVWGRKPPKPHRLRRKLTRD